jgi:glutamate-5-semialdehyde dehydrogenase
LVFTVANAQTDLDTLSRRHAENARGAAGTMALAPTSVKNRWLLAAADALGARTGEVLAANARDVAAAPQFGLNAAAVDRLTLTASRIAAAAEGLRQVAELPDPVGRVLESSVRPNGLRVQKIGVPIGVVFFIYESRPNVTIDAAGLCVKSGNAVILRGGKESIYSNIALHRILADELMREGLPENAVELVPTTDRRVVGNLLAMGDLIDLAIPRGGKGLVERVAAEAVMPVLKHYDGVCHVYVDAAADLDMAERIIINAKCQRPGVCNAAESVLVHSAVAADFLPRIGRELSRRGVEMRGCAETRKYIHEARAASEADYRTEYLDLILSMRVVDSLDAAVAHIDQYGSKHTDAIVTRDDAVAREFARRVDSSAVMVNASTRFNDGFELGLGAEIGISTDKFHARGPCGLRELTTYKYVVTGDGHVRE